MRKIEHKRILLPLNDAMWTKVLNIEGLDGWELVQIYSHVNDKMAYLKREIIHGTDNRKNS